MNAPVDWGFSVNFPGSASASSVLQFVCLKNCLSLSFCHFVSCRYLPALLFVYAHLKVAYMSYLTQKLLR